MPYYQTPLNEIPDPGDNLRELLGLMDRDQPINLEVLDNPPAGEKPNYPYPTLIKLAIYGSPRKRLTLQEIYQALEGRFEWFKNSTDAAWKVRSTFSIRSRSGLVTLWTCFSVRSATICR